MNHDNEWFSPENLLEASKRAEGSLSPVLDASANFGSYAKVSCGDGIQGSSIMRIVPSKKPLAAVLVQKRISPNI